jgi:hypothetical protein
MVAMPKTPVVVIGKCNRYGQAHRHDNYRGHCESCDHEISSLLQVLVLALRRLNRPPSIRQAGLLKYTRLRHARTATAR